jgi:hypothetical protein
MSLERAPGRRPAASGGGDSSIFPFETTAGISLAVAVEAGTVIFHEDRIAYAGTDDYAVTPNLSGGVVYAFLDDEFAPTSVGISLGASLPTQPNAPARKYMELAQIQTDAGGVTAISIYWKGNIIWPSIYGFWA